MASWPCGGETGLCPVKQETKSSNQKRKRIDQLVFIKVKNFYSSESITSQKWCFTKEDAHTVVKLQKILGIITHPVCTHQNHGDGSKHPPLKGLQLKGPKMSNVSKGMAELELSYLPRGSINCFNHLEKVIWLLKLNIHVPYDVFLCTQEKWKCMSSKRHITK